MERIVVPVAAALVLLNGPAGFGCAGPQPLDVAIDPADELAYATALDAAELDSRKAFIQWMSAERGLAPDAVVRADAQISESRNPFDARRDRRAVSRGAVLYKVHCAKCHGEDTRGEGPATLARHPASNFKSPLKRLSVTLFGGAAGSWFRAIRDGKGDEVEYPLGATAAMPPFGGELTREQIWLTITYLQSLDMYAPAKTDD